MFHYLILSLLDVCSILWALLTNLDSRSVVVMGVSDKVCFYW